MIDNLGDLIFFYICVFRSFKDWETRRFEDPDVLLGLVNCVLYMSLCVLALWSF